MQRYDGRRRSSSKRESQGCRKETSLERETRGDLERSMIEQRALEAVMQREREQTNANQTILQQLEELKEAMENNNEQGGKTKMAESIEEAERSPFSQEILQALILAKCALPTFSSIFHGTGNAVQHMKAYNLTLMPWAQHQAMLCKYFPASLTGEASLWFDNLCEGSVTSFTQLKTLFLGNYIINNRAKVGIENAPNLKKAYGKSLRSLTTRWRTMCSESAGEVSERHLILAFVSALYPTDLLYVEIFQHKNKIDMQELREYQEEFIALEENK
ncbi:uncharacterized protein LOC113351247 [Papaver somniferum]|uniref:uncharacterized protein LOC113351247 n=1 Tax=Papaver somniferum TaxID=3469 RepID=UPI000E6FE35A|nr:uncharacterized protein LOC113351247 [Papaver somniferum]